MEYFLPCFRRLITSRGLTIASLAFVSQRRSTLCEAQQPPGQVMEGLGQGSMVLPLGNYCVEAAGFLLGVRSTRYGLRGFRIVNRHGVREPPWRVLAATAAVGLLTSTCAYVLYVRVHTLQGPKYWIVLQLYP